MIKEEVDELFLAIIDLIENKYPNTSQGFSILGSKEDIFANALANILSDLFDSPDYKNYN